MTAYILRRLAQAVALVAVVITATFFLLQFVPGDPATNLVGEDALEEDREAARKAYGLDRPLHHQYVTYVARLVTGDLGYSYISGAPVVEVIAASAPPTLLLTGSALVVSTIVGLLAGVSAARRPNGMLDRIVTSTALLAQAVPGFWLAQGLVLIVALKISFLPVQGYSQFGSQAPTGLGHVADVAHHLVLPMLVLAASEIAAVVRLVRSGVVSERSAGYVRTARSKGLDEETVFNRHALRNALLPVITLIGVRVGFLFSGSVVVESVFVWPGLGSVLRSAAERADRPLLLGLVILIAVAIAVANLVTDLAYTWADPRVRVRR
ncbi:MAG: ABC transporter permease [Acidimicrobiales bacterium]